MKSHGKAELREAVSSHAGVAPRSLETGFGCLCLSVATPQQCSCAGQPCSRCLTGLGTELGLTGKDQEPPQVPGQGNTKETSIPALLCNLKKDLKAAKGHVNASPDREHTFSERRKKSSLSAY